MSRRNRGLQIGTARTMLRNPIHATDNRVTEDAS